MAIEKQPMNPFHIPTEEDWGDWADGLDKECAHGNFAGKSNAAMMAEYYEDALGRAEELGCMPPVPFRYYVLGFRDYLLYPKYDHSDDSDAANSFLSLIEHKLYYYAPAILPVMNELISTVTHVADHQADFGAALEFYGDFQEKRISIERLYQQRLNG
jgi:hypothetical protein